jgi:site-specific recombinase XerD
VTVGKLPVVTPASPPALTDVLTSAASYAEAEKAESTRRAYRADWRHFRAWCEGNRLSDLPAEPGTVAAYLAHLADTGRTVSTVTRRLAAISYAHRLKGYVQNAKVEPIGAVVRGIRRRIGIKANQKSPATAPTLHDMLEHVPRTTLAGARDRALLLLGFAGALRRSELAALHVSDLVVHPDGLMLHIRRSKTDQDGEGHLIPIPRGGRLKPVEALEAWLAVSGITEGPVFRRLHWGRKVGTDALGDHSVADIIKRYALAAGLDPKLFSGHSLRAGFVTSALEHGADLFKVMDVTRHRRVETLKGYDRRARAFRDHAGKDFL